jgi:hypothetical protein
VEARGKAADAAQQQRRADAEKVEEARRKVAEVVEADKRQKEAEAASKSIAEAVRTAAAAGSAVAASAAAAVASAAAAPTAVTSAQLNSAGIDFMPVTPQKASSSSMSPASPSSTLDLLSSPVSTICESCPVLTKALSMHIKNSQLKSRSNKSHQSGSRTKDALGVALLKTAKQRLGENANQAGESAEDGEELLQKFLKHASLLKKAESYLIKNKAAAMMEVRRVLFE